MAGGGSHDRRKLRRAELRSVPETSSKPTIPEVLPKTKKPKHFGEGDSYTVLALLVGVFLVIIVPPLTLKAILLIAVCIGVLRLARRSHWTYSWSGRRRYGAASAIVIILLAVGIPQFISQWKAAHPIRSVLSAPALPSGQSQPLDPAPRPTPRVNGLTLDDVQIRGFGTGVKNNSEGQLNFKDSKINDNGVGIDNQNPKAQLNFDHSEVSRNKIGIINRDSVKKDAKKEVKQP